MNDEVFNFFFYHHDLITHHLLKKKSSQLIYESVKALEIKTFILFNVLFANIPFHFAFFFFLINGPYVLIPALIAQTFNPVDKLVISLRMPSKEAKGEIETHPILAEAKLRNCLVFKIAETFLCFLLINSIC